MTGYIGQFINMLLQANGLQLTQQACMLILLGTTIWMLKSLVINNGSGDIMNDSK